MYSGEVEAADSNLFELMVAADKYLVQDLVEQCERRMLASLRNPEEGNPAKRMIDALNAGFRLDCKPLKVVAFKYLRENHKQVLASQEWAEFVAADRVFAGEILLCAMSGAEPPESERVPLVIPGDEDELLRSP